MPSEYFDCVKRYDVKDLVNDHYCIYAHTKEAENPFEREKETLEAHTNLCEKHFLSIFYGKNFTPVFENFENMFLEGGTNPAGAIFKEIALNTVILHDIGKVNASFQKIKMKNNLNIADADQYKNSHHSLLSSVIYMDIYYEKIKAFYEVHKDRNERDLLFQFMVLNAYVMARHHGKLRSFEEFKEKFKEGCDGDSLLGEQRVLFQSTCAREIRVKRGTLEKILNFMSKLPENMAKTSHLTVQKMIYVRLMLSLLVTSDFYATSEYKSGVEIKDIGNLNDIDAFYNVYKSGKLFQEIRAYERLHYSKRQSLKDEKDINILRNELFLDAEKELMENISGNIFYLEAPTGSGKSNVALNLSFLMMEKDKSKKKIFYVYPFNTLVEQNKETLEGVFLNEDSNKDELLQRFAIINSVEPIKQQFPIRENEGEDAQFHYYESALLNHQFLNYPIVLTTHVTLFQYLFGIEREDIFPVHQLANSIIVLDEIQSYKNSIWTELITFLTSYAKVLNIKIMIMSATLPNLDYLTLNQGMTVNLIKDREKYFNHALFKNRVAVDYSLLDVGIDIKKVLYEHVCESSKSEKKILIEFISKETAYQFYEKLKFGQVNQQVHCEIELMTGDDNIAERKRILDKVKSTKQGIILVATQVVEAGIDIDMDIGYKNISIFDSEEQFLGRINRACKKKQCIAYFFEWNDDYILKRVYKNDVRANAELSLKNEIVREWLLKKQFQKFYGEVIRRLKHLNEALNESNVELFFNEKVGNLDFPKIEEKMKLIEEDEKKVSIFLNHAIINLKGEELSGELVWNQYKELLQDNEINYAEKRIKLSQVRSEANYFIYQVRYHENFTYNDRIGELYYIDHGYRYLENGKFDRAKFLKGIGDFI